MHRTANNDSLAERMVDSQTASFSFRDIISKIFLRPKLFLFALLAPTIIATTMTAVVPVDWSASAKILIRYSIADTAFMKNIVSDSGLGLSGATSAELIKSIPVLERTIDNVGIKKEDVYKTSGKVIIEKIVNSVTRLLQPGSVFGKQKQTTPDPAQVAIERTDLINNFKASLESSSKKTGNGQSIEILEKNSQVPESMKLDELITVEVKSFNREKVDDIANGLAEAFIDEYYAIYSKAAKHQSEYIKTLLKKEEAALITIEKATPSDLVNDASQANSGSSEVTARDAPILASLATELSVAEATLSKTRQIYAPNSTQVRRISTQVENLRFMLKKQERIEISKQLIEQLKSKLFQSQNTEKIYQNRLVPINIIERANEPIQTNAKKIIRMIMSLLIGLILGLIFSISLMITLNALDPRIHFKKDVEELSTVPVIGQTPRVDLSELTPLHIRNHEKISQSMWHLISKIGQKSAGNTARIITIASISKGEGGTLSAAALALNLAKNKTNRVCLIDANFADAGLSTLFNIDKKPGLIEIITDQLNVDDLNFIEHNMTLIGTGNLAKKTEIGYYSDTAQALINSLSNMFDYIVIDSGSVLNNNESIVFGKMASEFILIVSSDVTRKNALSAAERKLNLEALKANGILFNNTQKVLPELIYKML